VQIFNPKINAKTNPKTVGFTLQNSLGQVVLQGDNLPETLDLQAFARGVYWLKTEREVVKIVKN
jgi:hypothetical protein